MTKRRLYHLAALLAACCAAQRGAAATITTVGTAAALREAFERGAEHIEIVRHLDLTALPRSPASPAKDPDLFRPGPSTKTVRIFFWNAGVNVVWLDGLNINMPRDSNQASLLVFWSPDARSRLYLTNSALQSNSVTNSRGIFVQDAPAYIEGTTFFGTTTSAVSVASTTSVLNQCTFAGNRADSDGDGVIKVADGTNVTLAGPRLRDNAGSDIFLGGPGARLFTDVTDNSLRSGSGSGGRVLPLASPEAPRNVITAQDAAITQYQTELSSAERVVGVNGAGGDSDDDSFPIAAVAGGAAAALALLLLALLLCVFRRRVFGRCARRASADGGGKTVSDSSEAAAAPESPAAREARRTQKRALYDKLQAAAREKRQPSYVAVHPSALAAGAVDSLGGAATHSGLDQDIKTLTVGTATGTSPPGSDSAARLARGEPSLSGELATAATLSTHSHFGYVAAPPVGVLATPGKTVDDAQAAQLLWAQQQQAAAAAAAAGVPPHHLAANSFMHNSMLSPSMLSPSMLHSGMGSAMGASLFPSAMSSCHNGGAVMVPCRAAKDKLSKALEAMATAYPPVPFAGEYILSVERITGRQAMLVFAADQACAQYAVKFFHTYKDWERESKAAAHPRLRKLLPPVSLVAENLDEATGILEAPNGYKFPSFIVMERGCSLADWQQRQPLSIAAAISMVYEIATLLTTLHRVGRAHRDVQPDNILLMVQTQAWKLSDFAVAGTIGRRKSVSPHCALTFAAPEAVIAFEDDRQLAVHASQDVWSLGVVAYTVLTHSDVFDEAEGLDAVSEFAHSKRKYPWEAEGAAGSWLACPARELIQPCLNRDPMRRPSAAEFVRSITAFVNANARKPFMQ